MLKKHWESAFRHITKIYFSFIIFLMKEISILHFIEGENCQSMLGTNRKGESILLQCGATVQALL